MALFNKLIKLKKWLTLTEAAQHLSLMFKENVNEADVLRWALDGHLILSVNFANQVFLRYLGKYISFEEWEANYRREFSWAQLRPVLLTNDEIGFDLPCFGVFLPGRERENVYRQDIVWESSCEELKEKFLKGYSPEQQAKFLAEALERVVAAVKMKAEICGGKVTPDFGGLWEDKLICVNGLWDLPMDLGSARYHIECTYKHLISYPVEKLYHHFGIWLRHPENGELWELQKRYGIKDFGKIGLFSSFSSKQGQPAHPDNFCPATSLPEDSVLVIRVSALNDLKELLEKDDEVVSKNNMSKDGIGNRERGTWLKIIYLLAMKIAEKNKAVYLKKDALNATAFETLMKTIARDLHVVKSLNDEDKPEQISSITHGMSDATLSKIFNEGEKLINKYFE